MTQNVKYAVILAFVSIWLIAIMIGFQKGKKAAYQAGNEQYIEDIHKEDDQTSLQKQVDILIPKPILYQMADELEAPKLYALKISSIKDDIRIINEKGDELPFSQSDRYGFNLYSFNIFDSDLKTEEELKKQIQFDLEEQEPEEFHKGIEELEIKEERSLLYNTNIKKADSLIYTNR